MRGEFIKTKQNPLIIKLKHKSHETIDQQLKPKREKKNSKKQEMRHNLKILEENKLNPEKAVTGLNKKNITRRRSTRIKE